MISGLFIGKFLAVLGMLHYYSNPLPGVAFSFHQIFSETARHMAALIDLSILDQFVQRIQAITSGLEKPDSPTSSGSSSTSTR